MTFKPSSANAPVLFAVALAFVLTAHPLGAPRPPDIPFRTQMLDGGASETAAVADINKDGRLDIVSGENWYEAPNWTRRHFRDLGFSGNYIDGSDGQGWGIAKGIVEGTQVRRGQHIGWVGDSGGAPHVSTAR